MSKKDRQNGQVSQIENNQTPEAGPYSELSDDAALSGQEYSDGADAGNHDAGAQEPERDHDAGLVERIEALSDDGAFSDEDAVLLGELKAEQDEIDALDDAGDLIDATNVDEFEVISLAGEALSDDVATEKPSSLTRIADILDEYHEEINHAQANLMWFKDGTGDMFEELFGFYRDNPAAPLEAGLIHISRKFKISMPRLFRNNVFTITLGAMRIFVSGILAHHEAMQFVKIIAEHGVSVSQDRAPFTGEAAFKPDDAPFGATGFAVE